MTIFDPTILGIVPCSCGRLSTKAHCPFCGCYTLYISTKKKDIRHNPNTGEKEELPIYRCRRCARYFNEFNWQNECIAPRFESRASLRLKELQTVYDINNNNKDKTDLRTSFPLVQSLDKKKEQKFVENRELVEAAERLRNKHTNSAKSKESKGE